MLNLCFVSGGICGSRSAFRFVRVVKHRFTIFSSSGGTCTDSTKSAPRQVMQNLCFCILWVLRIRYCIPVRPGHETSTHYFSCMVGTGTDPIKSSAGYVPPKLHFCIRWVLRVMLCILVHPGCKTSTHYFLYSGGTDTDFQKKSRQDTLR
jgi:hypothetical protein